MCWTCVLSSTSPSPRVCLLIIRQQCGFVHGRFQEIAPVFSRNYTSLLSPLCCERSLRKVSAGPPRASARSTLELGFPLSLSLCLSLSRCQRQYLRPLYRFFTCECSFRLGASSSNLNFDTIWSIEDLPTAARQRAMLRKPTPCYELENQRRLHQTLML